MTDAIPTAEVATFIVQRVQFYAGTHEALVAEITKVIRAHAAQAVAEERERCAKVVDAWGADRVAAIIRAGQPGQEPTNARP